MGHVMTRFLWVQERIKLNHFTLDCIDGKQHPAELMTKTLTINEIQQHCKRLNVHEFQHCLASVSRNHLTFSTYWQQRSKTDCFLPFRQELLGTDVQRTIRTFELRVWLFCFTSPACVCLTLFCVVDMCQNSALRKPANACLFPKQSLLKPAVFCTVEQACPGIDGV